MQTLNQFPVNHVWYRHCIDTNTDATYICNESDEVLYRVDSDANVFDRAGKIGVFRTDKDNLWYFQGLSGLIIETGNISLIKAEMKVFKQLLVD